MNVPEVAPRDGHWQCQGVRVHSQLCVLLGGRTQALCIDGCLCIRVLRALEIKPENTRYIDRGFISPSPFTSSFPEALSGANLLHSDLILYGLQRTADCCQMSLILQPPCQGNAE